MSSSFVACGCGQLVGRSVSRSVGWLVAHSVSRVARQSVGWPVSCSSVSRKVGQWMGRSVGRSVGRSADTCQLLVVEGL